MRFHLFQLDRTDSKLIQSLTLATSVMLVLTRLCFSRVLGEKPLAYIRETGFDEGGENFFLEKITQEFLWSSNFR